MKDWFLGLEKRERLFVLVGAAAGVVVVIWGLLLNPLYSASTATANSIDSKRNTLAFLRVAAAEIAASGDAPADRPDLSGQSLVVVVDRSARQAGLGTALTRNQPVGDDGIRVRLDDASFDAVARWLATLNAGSGLAIDSASFDRTPAEGRVNASIVLRQGLQ